MSAVLHALPEAHLLVDGVRGGNVVARVGAGADARILKLYRERRGAWRSFWQGVSHRCFEGKRGVSPAARCETERTSLHLWKEHGFDVPRIIDAPLPPGVEQPGLWLEYCPGPVLTSVLLDQDRLWAERRALLVRFAAEMARRHALAIELSQPLLIPEHATTAHVLVSGDRLVTFDLEGGFRPDFPMLEAMTLEVSGLLRQVAKATGERFDDALDAIVEGYGDADRLRRICRWGVEGRGMVRRVKRLQDRWRRPLNAKTRTLERLLVRMVEPGAGDSGGEATCEA